MLSKCVLSSAIKKLLSFSTILDHFCTNEYPLTKGIYLYNIHGVLFTSIFMEIVSCQTLCISYIFRIHNSFHEALVQSDLTRSLQKNEAFVRNLHLKFFQGPKSMEDFQIMLLPDGEETQQISTFCQSPPTTPLESSQNKKFKSNIYHHPKTLCHRLLKN